MFSEMMIVSSGRRKVRATWLTLPLSLALHAVAVAGLVVGPMLAAGSVPPEARIQTVALLAPAPQPPAVPVGRSSARPHREVDPARSQPPPRINVFQVNTLDIPDGIPDEDPVGSGGNGLDLGFTVEGGDPSGLEGAPPMGGEYDPSRLSPIRVGTLQKPHKLREVAPEYPLIAIQSRTQGVVVIEAETDVYGRVRTARVVTGHPLLNDAALRAVKQWLYEPYVVNGEPHPVVFSVTVTFTLATR
jgi:periplasmic protein TonB